MKPCPVCGCMLQRPTRMNTDEFGPGAAPHFKVCHPGLPVPAVAW